MFYEEVSKINPLVPAPEKDHNDDPDLFIYDNKYSIVYLETLRPETQKLVLLVSTDRLSWNSRLIHTWFLSISNSDPFIVSPTFVNNGDNNYLFYVKLNNNSNNEIQFVKIETEFKPDFSHPVNVSFDKKIFNPWHISIIHFNSSYFMLICCIGENYYNLYIAHSYNLLNWIFSEKLLMKNAYRSTGFIKDNNLFLYFSRKNILNTWEIGITKKNISDHFLYETGNNS